MSNDFFTAFSKCAGVLPSVESFGLSSWDPVWTRKKHTSNHVEIVHVVQGLLRMHTERGTFTARTGDTLIVPLGLRHRDEFTPGPLFTVLHIQFCWKRFERFFALEDIAALLSLPSSHKQEIHRKVIELYSALCTWGIDAAGELLVRSLLSALLVHVKAFTTLKPSPGPTFRCDTSKNKHDRLLKHVEEYVKDNLSSHIRCSTIASKLGISTYHLSHLFSKRKGFTLSSFILRCRMEKAADLLRSSLLRVSEISYQVGFEDPNYFAKCFKRHFGGSPSTYRELH